MASSATNVPASSPAAAAPAESVAMVSCEWMPSSATGIFSTRENAPTDDVAAFLLSTAKATPNTLFDSDETDFKFFATGLVSHNNYNINYNNNNNNSLLTNNNNNNNNTTTSAADVDLVPTFTAELFAVVDMSLPFQRTQSTSSALVEDAWLNSTLSDSDFDTLLSVDAVSPTDSFADVVVDMDSVPTTPDVVLAAPTAPAPAPAPTPVAAPRVIVRRPYVPPTPASPEPEIPELVIPPGTSAERVKYLKRRHNNNLSAQRSRVKRRELEEQNARRVHDLENENADLRDRLALLEAETARLRDTVKSFAVPARK